MLLKRAKPWQPFSAKVTFHPPRLKSNHAQRILPPSAIPLNYRYPTLLWWFLWNNFWIKINICCYGHVFSSTRFYFFFLIIQILWVLLSSNPLSLFLALSKLPVCASSAAFVLTSLTLLFFFFKIKTIRHIAVLTSILGTFSTTLLPFGVSKDF